MIDVSEILSGSLLTIGYIFMITGAYFCARAFWRLLKYKHALGIVIGHENIPDADGNAYYPTIRFESASGDSIIFKARVGTSSEVYKIGETVDVIFREGAPGTAALGTLHYNFFFPIFLILMGGALVLGGGEYTFE